MGVDVRGPKPLDTHPGEEIVAWALAQLDVARAIMDDPGGGLLFAPQAIGQVKAGLRERDEDRWREVVEKLDRAEDAGVHRRFADARRLVDEARAAL